MQILGYSAFAIAAFFAGTNFYLSSLRAPLHRWLGRKCRDVTGIPIVGTLFVIGALALLEWSAMVWIGAIALCAIDTGGLPWFCLMMALQITQRKREEDKPKS
jgi:hypothetical protein